MTVDFKYRRIGPPLVEDLVSLLRSGKSGVLLGLRNLGKRHLLHQVAEKLRGIGEASIIHVELMSELPLSKLDDIRRCFAVAAGQASGGHAPQSGSAPAASKSPSLPAQNALPLIPVSSPGGGERSRAKVEGEVNEQGSPGHSDDPSAPLLAALDALQQSAGKTIYLIAANVDAIAHHQARRLLQELQVRVKNQRLVVLLSGEENLCELVHGPNSEFDCTDQFVLQGFDLPEFTAYLQRRLAFLRLQLPPVEWTAKQLFDLTGGNVRLLRAVLASLVEARAQDRTRPDDGILPAVAEQEIAALTASFPLSGSHAEAALQWSFRILDRDSTVWPTLQSLLKDNRVEVAHLHPHLLELAGVCVREDLEAQASILGFASPLMASAARRYYDARHWGDLHAAHGLWTRAFEHYATLDADAKIRPTDVDDRQAVLYAVKDLCSALHVEATRGEPDFHKLERVRNLFAHGCQDVLGFPNVSFWLHEKAWKPLQAEMPSGKPQHDALELLTKVNPRQRGWHEVASQTRRLGAVIVLPSLREDQHEGVVVGDFENGIPISREREQLLKDLASHLLDAYSHAISVVRARLRLKERNQHLQIVNSIFQALGATVRDPLQALQLAGSALMALGYRRVLFCMVDPVEKEIRGALDLSDDLHFINVAEQTRYPLDNPLADIQPYVFSKGESFIVSDAASEPLVNKKVQKMAGMTSFAVVPMLNPDGDCVGTIHIEREDRAVPSKEEVEDLEMFGRQLALALALSERVNLLQVSLDKLQEPIVIVDRLQMVRYANEPAAALFGFPKGWCGSKDLVRFESQRTKPIAPMVGTCLTNPHRSFQHVRGLGSNPDDPAEVLIDAVKDVNGVLVGVMVHVADLSYLYRVFRALELVAESVDVPSAMRALLNAIERLGHKWGRLYCIPSDRPDVLVSEKGYGFADPDSRFDGHKIELLRKTDKFDESWLSMNSGKPVVFLWSEEHKDGHELHTPQGLPVKVVREPMCPELFGKRPGDYWLDLPILAEETALGKLTVECSASLKPDEFELLKVLLEAVTQLLSAMSKAEVLQKAKEQWLQEAADKAIAVAAHNIGTRLAALDVLATRCQALPEKSPALNALNQDLTSIVANCLSAVDRIKELFAKVVPRLSTLRVTQLLSTTLRLRLPESACELQCPESLEAEWDERLLENALLEMVQNSIEMAKSPEEVRIWVSVTAFEKAEDSWIRIEYEDNGPGVPDELKQSIFDAFFSRRPGKRSGTGLGLHFVGKVVQAHGGSIAESGCCGKGARFIIELPARPAIQTEDK